MDEVPREITAGLVFLSSADSNDPFHAPCGVEIRALLSPSSVRQPAWPSGKALGW